MSTLKDSGERRICPLCGESFKETMPLGTNTTGVRWVPRPVCTKHGVDNQGRPTT